MDKSKFGQFIKEARKNKNLTQKQLADLLFLDVTAVSKWERGVSYPDITLIPDICKILEISEHELIESSYDTKYREMKEDADKYNKTKNVIFWTLNVLYTTALVVCFIVNLAVDKKLSWFFIVLSSILCAYTFIPTVTRFVKTKKLLIFLGSSLIGLFVLFLTCSLFTNNYWFMIAITGVILGYFMIFYPILFVRQKRYLDEDGYNKVSKYFLLSYSIIILILIVLLLILINIYNPYNLLLGIVITISIMTLPIIIGLFMSLGLGKVIVRVLIGLVVAGMLFGLSTGILNLIDNEYIENTYEITNDFTDIKIDIKESNVKIVEEASNARIETKQKENTDFVVEVKNDVLTIVETSNYKWYQHIWNIRKNVVTIYIPYKTIGNLDIDGSTSDIKIDDNISFSDVRIKLSTGDTYLSSIKAKSLDLYCSTGDIIVNNVNVDSDIKLDTSTGDIKLIKTACKTLNINISTGDVFLSDVLVLGDMIIDGGTSDVYLERFDATNIEIEISTGDVKGTILTPKIFMTKSSTGYISVPEIQNGGKCKITTSTGDIIITYE